MHSPPTQTHAYTCTVQNSPLIVVIHMLFGLIFTVTDFPAERDDQLNTVTNATTQVFPQPQ